MTKKSSHAKPTLSKAPKAHRASKAHRNTMAERLEREMKKLSSQRNKIAKNVRKQSKKLKGGNLRGGGYQDRALQEYFETYPDRKNFEKHLRLIEKKEDEKRIGRGTLYDFTKCPQYGLQPHIYSQAPKYCVNRFSFPYTYDYEWKHK